MSQPKTLKSVLGQNIKIPKSYERYLFCKVVLEKEEYIEIQTPKGIILSFKIEDNSLKKINPQPNTAFDTPLSEPKPKKRKPEIVEVKKSGLDENLVKKRLKDLNERLKYLEGKNEPTKELIKKRLTNLNERLKPLEEKNNLIVSQGSGSFIVSEKEWRNLQKQVEEICKIKSNLFQITETQWLELQQKIKENAQYIKLLEEQLQIKVPVEKVVSTEKLAEKSIPNESMEKIKENSKKIAISSGKVAVKGGKFLINNPKFLFALMFLIILLAWQPWTYVTRWWNNKPSNEYSSSYRKGNDIIPKGKDYKSKNKHTLVRHEEKLLQSTSYLSVRDKAYEKELRQDNDPNVREWIENIAHLSESEKKEKLKHLSESNQGNAGKILVRMLKSKNVSIRWTAVRELGKMRFKPCVPFLIKKLQDTAEQSHIREEIASSLGILGNISTSKLLLQIFMNKGEHEGVRINSGIALGFLGNANVSQTLLRAMEDSNPRIQEAAITALGKFGYPTAIIPIMDILKVAEDIDLKISCVIALGNMRRKVDKIATLLVNQLEDGDPDLEEDIKASLRNLLPLLKRTQKEEVSELIKE